MVYLEAISLVTPESVPHTVVLTDGEKGGGGPKSK